ncbi:MAG: hypothetical protein BGO67_11010 [Alphaproteobacteria bacterium 41-28]|nr:MAG: hypothetical protein BGO67_11010 [Alphaproteobacteria bacterium 41-28]
MIDYKKIATATAILSLMGTTASFAMEASKEELEKKTITIHPAPQVEENSGHLNPSLPSDNSGAQEDEIEQLMNRMAALYMQNKERGDQEAKQSEQQREELANLKKKLEEAETREREAQLRAQAAEVERLRQVALEEQLRAEEAEKHRLKLERLAQEVEEAENARKAAEAKRKSDEEAIAAALLGGRTPEQVAHNVNTEVTRGVESLNNFLAGKGWKHDKKLKKKKKHKKEGRK